MASPQLVSVNVGRPRATIWAGRLVTSAIWKEPVQGRIVVEGVNLHGDDQADRRVHGGRDKAVYAYSAEDYAWWAGELGASLGPGTFGENLTTQGIDLGECVIGQQWCVGSTVLEVAQPREPCFKLGMRMGDAGFVGRFGSSGRPGAYLRIVKSGEVGVEDPILLGSEPVHGLTVGDLAEVGPDTSVELLERIAHIREVPEDWREATRRRLLRMGSRS